jgi:hypothetical protein
MSVFVPGMMRRARGLSLLVRYVPYQRYIEAKTRPVIGHTFASRCLYRVSVHLPTISRVSDTRRLAVTKAHREALGKELQHQPARLTRV